MRIFKERNTLKRTLRYIFFVTLIFWILATVYVVYQYLWASSKQVITKGGTFVEGIFDTTSFLPYLNNDWQSKFYQGFLFDKCLDFELNIDGRPEYKDNLCHITTRDYKTYYTTILSGYTRSDGVPLTIDDVYFTYKDIIKNNKLGVPYIESYSDIEVSMDDNKLKVVFKNSSEDNTLFFTNYILPKHALINPNQEMYQQSFAIEPVYNNCAKIKSQSTDQYSLIFNLSDCIDTNLGFYQIKNAISFDTFKDGIEKGNGSIIDAYIGPENLKGYGNINLESNRLVTLFFNTNSDKMTVRLRRALGGLINYNLFDKDKLENEYMRKYDRDIFNHHLSTGANIKGFIDRVDMNDELSKDDLIDGGVEIMTGTMEFSNKNKAFAFYTEDAKQKFLIRLNFDKKYDKIAIQHNSGDLYYPKSYKTKNQYSDYGIAKSYKNLNEGLNKYVVYGFNKSDIKGENKDGKSQIGTINIYNLYKNVSVNEPIKEQLKIVYFDNNLSSYIVGRLKQIFKQYDISDSFLYEKISDTNELEGKLIAGEYDIVINSIDMGLNTDISKLFATEVAVINPSQYTNARLLSLLKQYNESKNKGKIVSEINKIYANDMPMIVLGREYIKLNIKEYVMKKLDMDNLNLYEYNRRDEIYHNLSLTENIYIDKERAKDIKNFWNFIRNPNDY